MGPIFPRVGSRHSCWCRADPHTLLAKRGRPAYKTGKTTLRQPQNSSGREHRLRELVPVPGATEPVPLTPLRKRPTPLVPQHTSCPPPAGLRSKPLCAPRGFRGVPHSRATLGAPAHEGARDRRGPPLDGHPKRVVGPQAGTSTASHAADLARRGRAGPETVPAGGWPSPAAVPG